MSTQIEKSIAATSQILRILIADDHELVRQGLRKLLEPQVGWQVCGEATNGLDAVQMAQSLHPDLVVLDVHMPGLNGFEAASQIAHSCHGLKILILTLDESGEVLRQGIEAGAHGMITKSDATSHITNAILAMVQNGHFYSPRFTELMTQSPLTFRPLSSPRAALTKRERDVVVQLAKGLTGKEIAAVLCISVKTVETHRANVMRKLTLGSRAELVRYAIRNGLVPP